MKIVILQFQSYDQKLYDVIYVSFFKAKNKMSTLLMGNIDLFFRYFLEYRIILITDKNIYVN